MVRRKIDNRIRVLIENGVTLGHRTMFVVVGEKARDQVSIQLNTCMYFEDVHLVLVFPYINCHKN